MPDTVVCVGAVVKQGARVLLVRQSEGHSLAGQWTIPWGRLDPGESPAAAAVRETLEESSIRAELRGLLCVQELPAPWEGWFALIYQCEHVEGEPAPDGFETDAARYFSATELGALREPIEPWSEWLVQRVFSSDVALKLGSDRSNPFGPGTGFL